MRFVVCTLQPVRCCAWASRYTEVQYLTADFQSFGLCYLSNCYTDNYLQIGLKTSLGGIKWFRCQEAGDVYVSGFIGTFTCPDPADFCA